MTAAVFSPRLRYRSCWEYPPLPCTGILPSVVGSGGSGVQGMAGCHELKRYFHYDLILGLSVRRNDEPSDASQHQEDKQEWFFHTVSFVRFGVVASKRGACIPRALPATVATIISKMHTTVWTLRRAKSYAIEYQKN